VKPVEEVAEAEGHHPYLHITGWNNMHTSTHIVVASADDVRVLQALELVKRVGEVAEAEGHHPDLHITGWNNVAIQFTTHARGGLTQNDFICAAKVGRPEQVSAMVCLCRWSCFGSNLF
jgi:4a-hydroxytetrahydrobiopterin dehydratase